MRTKTIIRLIGLAATPLVAVTVTLLVYGPAQLNAAVDQGTTVAQWPADVSRVSGEVGGLAHPYVADLAGVFSALVLVGLVVALAAGSVLVTRLGPGRPARHRQGGRHGGWVPRHVAVA